MPRASGLGAAIGRAFPAARVELVPGGRGDFVVTVDGRRVWDKEREQFRFPEIDEILALLRGD